MGSTGVLAETLRSITNIKLNELSAQRATFEENKHYLIFAADAESEPSKKLETLLDGCKRLSIQQKGPKHNALYDHLAQCVEQAIYDPSMTEALLKGEAQLRRELDVWSLRYEYASIYSQLVTEWLADGGPTNAPWPRPKSNARERTAHKNEWELYVFQALQTDQGEITSYLALLFCSTTDAQASVEKLRKDIHQFEETLTASDLVNEDVMHWCVTGLLRSDLLNERKKTALTDMSNHKESLLELGDVLNMRLSAIDTWSWAKTGVLAEQRRQIDGKYRIFHDEDLIDALLMEYLGRKWSVCFKSAFAKLQELNTATLTLVEEERRKYFLCPASSPNLAQKRHQVFHKDNFMSQLLERENEVLRGYEDIDQDDDVTFHRSHNDIKQSMLHLLSTEIALNTHLNKHLCVIRSDFKRFGPSISHSTIFAVMKFFGVSPKWLGFFRNAFEGMYFLECYLLT